MSQELRAFTVNLKSMNQDIPDPIVAGAGDAHGRTFRIIFDQEAEAQITPNTKIYLSWWHKQLNIKGYNVFTQKNVDPIIWEIQWPQAMLHEGDVLCCIEMVDDISIVQSTNFIVHVLSDPNDGSSFVVSDDFSEFQNAVIHLTCLSKKMKEQLEQQKRDFEKMASQFGAVKEIANKAYIKSIEAIQRTIAINDRIGEIPEEVTVKQYIDDKVHMSGINPTEAIQKAKQEAIEASKRYTDSQLVLHSF